MYLPIILKTHEREKMDIFLYIIIFIMGTVFGSFFTLAVYRIPKRQDIVHTHSYCPNCDHKLGFLDLIPVLSYIFLGGKCRYCKKKIRPRYLILEILSGLTFVTIAYLSNINILNLDSKILAESAFMTLYLCYIFLMAGIDRENREINRSVNGYGIIISILYMIYLCILEKASIYRYGIYLVFYVLIMILDNITLKKYAKNSYLNGLLVAVIIMAIFTYEYITMNSIIMTSLIVAIYMLLNKIKNIRNRRKRKPEEQGKRLCVGFYLAVANIMNIIMVLGCYKFLV